MFRNLRIRLSARYRDIRNESIREYKRRELRPNQIREALAKDHKPCPWCQERTINRHSGLYTECLYCGMIVQRWNEPWVTYILFEDDCAVQVNIDGSSSSKTSERHVDLPGITYRRKTNGEAWKTIAAEIIKSGLPAGYRHVEKRRWTRPTPTTSLSTMSVSDAPGGE